MAKGMNHKVFVQPHECPGVLVEMIKVTTMPLRRALSATSFPVVSRIGCVDR
jgi:hypothetical protein